MNIPHSYYYASVGVGFGSIITMLAFDSFAAWIQKLEPIHSFAKRRHIDCVVVSISLPATEKTTHHIGVCYTYAICTVYYLLWIVNCEIKQWREKAQNGP